MDMFEGWYVVPLMDMNAAEKDVLLWNDTQYEKSMPPDTFVSVCMMTMLGVEEGGRTVTLSSDVLVSFPPRYAPHAEMKIWYDPGDEKS